MPKWWRNNPRDQRFLEFKTMAKASKTIKVEQTGSAIRRHHSQRSTLIGLKLNKIGREIGRAHV